MMYHTHTPHHTQHTFTHIIQHTAHLTHTPCTHHTHMHTIPYRHTHTVHVHTHTTPLPHTFPPNTHHITQTHTHSIPHTSDHHSWPTLLHLSVRNSAFCPGCYDIRSWHKHPYFTVVSNLGGLRDLRLECEESTWPRTPLRLPCPNSPHTSFTASLLILLRSQNSCLSSLTEPTGLCSLQI